jgi:signal transduction histidine kinase
VIARLRVYGLGVGKRWLQRRLGPDSVDRLLAAGLLLWALPDVPWWWRPPGHGRATPIVLGVLILAFAQSLPFLWRRRQPAAVLAVAAAALALKYGTGLNIWSAGAAVLVAGYGLGSYGSQPVRAMARVLTAAAGITAVIVLLTSGWDHMAAVPAALLAAALAMGEVASTRRDVAAAAGAHAHDLERARVAREFHDVIAHQLSAIAVQAGAARLASLSNPEAALEAVTAIEQDARHGLVELNRLVGALYREPGEHLDRAPQPQLRDLPDLIERAKESGLPAELVIEGEPRPLPAAVELAGYRVVQESLTNAVRYASGSPATVLVAYLGDGIVVQVHDDGAPEPGAGGHREGGGWGLEGLKERARLLGGQLDAGRRPDRGFVVRAWLPAGP